MPYLAHFGLKEHPFTLTPNTNQYFPIDKHVEIIQSIQFGIARNTGILKVVGDVGTGKTMLCRLLLRKLVGSNDAVAYLNAPQVDPESLVSLVCAEFGLETGARAQMLQGLNTFLLEQHALGRNAVLIVDEAQALGPAGLEAVRLLSNLETERNKLLQIVMFGQSELDDLLQRPDLRQVNQRIGFSFSTGPLTLPEAVHYMRHRVQASRVEKVDFPIFSDRAMEVLAQSASFIPRVLNILADKSLLVAYGEGAIQVTDRHAEQAIDDSPQLARPVRFQRRWVRNAMIGFFAIDAAALIALLLFNAHAQEWTKAKIASARAHFTASAAPMSPPHVSPPHVAVPAAVAPATVAPAEPSAQKVSAPSNADALFSFPAQAPLLVATGAIGLIFGSFVTALSYRLPRGESIAHGRSKCPACGHVLTAADLVPVVSWVINRGACRHCGVKISGRYPAIELATMTLCVAAALLSNDLRHFALLLFMAPVMMALVVIDLEHKRLPNVLVGILAALALAWRWSGDQNLTAALATATIAFVLGVLLDQLSRRALGSSGLGMGDTKLFALTGLALTPPVYLLFALIAGCFGVFWGLIWRARRGVNLFPFSPAILTSYWLALSFGDPVLRWLVGFVAG